MKTILVFILALAIFSLVSALAVTESVMILGPPSNFSYYAGSTLQNGTYYQTQIFVNGSGLCEFNLPPSYTSIRVANGLGNPIFSTVASGPKVQWNCTDSLAPYMTVYTLPTPIRSTGGVSYLSAMAAPLLPENVTKGIEQSPINQFFKVKMFNISLGLGIGAIVLIYAGVSLLFSGGGIIQVGLLIASLLMIFIYGGI